MTSRRSIVFRTPTIAFFFLVALFRSAAPALAQETYSLRSPDQKIEVEVRAGDRFKYDILLNGKPLLQDSTFSLRVDQSALGLAPKVKGVTRQTVNQEVVPVVPQKSSRIRENYNELRLEIEGNWRVVFRAYNEGVAYRLETSLPQRELKVYSEEVSLNFAGDTTRITRKKTLSFLITNESFSIYHFGKLRRNLWPACRR